MDWVGTSVLLAAVGDSIWLFDKSATTSAGSSVSSSVDRLPSEDSSSEVVHSLFLGRVLHILTCGFPYRQLKAVTL